MKKLLPLACIALALSACVDTSDLSAESSRPARGNLNGIVVAEYADLQCPACRSAHLTLNTLLLEQYGDRVRFEFRHFPLRSIHRYALDLAEGAECAADQGRFWEYVDMAYEKQPELDSSSVDVWAKELQLDSDLFGRCTASHIKRDTILADYDAGEALGVRGTPTYFVNGAQTPATIDALTTAIEQAMSGTGKKL